MTGLTNPKFDYGLIDKQEAAKLRYYEGELTKSRKRVADEIIAHGKILRGAQEVLANHGDGVFGAWLDSLGISRRTAYNAIAASEAFGEDCANLHNLEVSAMYELAKNEDAKKRALKLADKGVRITHGMAKEIIADLDAPKAPKREPAKQVSVLDASDAIQRQALGRQVRTPLQSTPDHAIEPHVAALDGETIVIGGTEPITPTDKCPNCAAVKWTADDDGGWACGRCHHPHGEPAGEPDSKRIAENRAKAVSRTEALMRDLDDLQHVCRSASHEEAMDAAQLIWKLLKAWK